MKQIATPILPPTSVVTVADKALETAYKAADAALSTTIVNNKTSQDAAISSAIAEWAADRAYKANNIVIRNRTFFYSLKDNTSKDPISDTAGNWSIFVPNEANSIFANRSPVSTDVQPSGVKWYDVSWGADSPLIFLSLGNGAWSYLNQITLTRIRFRVTGYNTTYRSELNNIKLYKADGVTQVPNNWFVWGASSGVSAPGAGSNFTGQKIGAGGNASGWADLEPSSSFDLNESISKITGSLAFANSNWIQLFYSNGGSKTFTPSDGNLATMQPPMVARYGNAIASVLGETLTAAKLTDAASLDAGRVNGQSFVSAWNILSQSMLNKIAALETKISILSARVPDSPPPTHANARPIADGQFINIIPGGGEFTYGTSRNAGTNSFTYPANTYKEAVSYYLDANDAVIPMTRTTQTIAADSTTLSIGAIAVSLEAIVYVVEFVRLDDSKIVYRVPLS